MAEHIPEIAEAYDEEAWKNSLTDTLVRNLTDSTMELMVAQAQQAAMLL